MKPIHSVCGMFDSRVCLRHERLVFVICQLCSQFGLQSAISFVANTDTLRFELILFLTVSVLFDRVSVTDKSCQL